MFFKKLEKFDLADGDDILSGTGVSPKANYIIGSLNDFQYGARQLTYLVDPIYIYQQLHFPIMGVLDKTQNKLVLGKVNQQMLNNLRAEIYQPYNLINSDEYKIQFRVVDPLMLTSPDQEDMTDDEKNAYPNGLYLTPEIVKNTFIHVCITIDWDKVDARTGNTAAKPLAGTLLVYYKDNLIFTYKDFRIQHHITATD